MTADGIARIKFSNFEKIPVVASGSEHRGRFAAAAMTHYGRKLGNYVLSTKAGMHALMQYDPEAVADLAGPGVLRVAAVAALAQVSGAPAGHP